MFLNFEEVLMKYVRCDRCGKEERLDLNRMAELRILKQEAGINVLVRVEDICELCVKEAWLRPKE